MSMTGVAIKISKYHASSNPVNIDILKNVYLSISERYLTIDLKQKFDNDLEKFFNKVLISLRRVSENRRFVDVSRS